MRSINEQLEQFKAIATNPRAQLNELLASGKKAIGVMPYFAPEELVYAAGMLPFGLWGAELQASESKKYYPAFYCSIAHTVLELGLIGALEGLSAVMVTLCCDTFKGMGANWKYGVKTIPVIDVPYAQNRKTVAGEDFTEAEFKKVLTRLEEIAGTKVSDEEIIAAIKIFNEDRRECMRFAALAAEHQDLIACKDRALVLKARYFMDRAEHARLLKELNEALAAEPLCESKFKRVVTTGILEDSQELMGIFDSNGLRIAADQIMMESVDNRYEVPIVPERPLRGFAIRLGQIEGASILYDPTKLRASQLIELVKAAKADGIIWVGAKFCDPEEFDYVPAKALAGKEGIPFIAVEIDQQMVNYEQVKTAIETFKDII